MMLGLIVLSAVVAHSARAGEYLVSDRATNQVLRYDESTGEFLGAFVDDNLETNGGLFAPAAMTFGFDNDLFVTSIDLNTGDGQVLRYDGETGAFDKAFATGLVGPSGIFFHEPSNSMLVGSLGTGLGNSNTLYQIDSDGNTAQTIEMGPVSGRTGMIQRADGSMLISGFAEEPFFVGSILEYDFNSADNTFSYSDVFAGDINLAGANGMTESTSGDLYVASLFGQSVIEFDIDGGVAVGSRVVAQTAYPSGVLQAADGTLLVTSLGNNNSADPIYPDIFPGAVFKFDIATGSMVGGAPFMVGGEEFQPTSILLRPDESSVSGDFDGDGLLTATDIDLLSVEVRSGTNDPAFDLNGDGQVTSDDRRTWTDLRNVYFGDANLDGEYNSTDMIDVFAAGEYEDDISGNSGWATGDWNGDAEFESGDLVLALQTGTYEQGPRAAIASVPEPATLGGYILGLLVAIGRLRPVAVKVRERRHR